ncbi:hypothetical protein Mgra_00004390 [Meloidogyne graminicola]|uniref:DB domain-containing protein n=1 Tax=Meloidogyne graminicola TaxID=189291 RepID=A0A8S9ZSL3_9BILA|nr:hypothetical protein Mgra_00004390 [Meloidogyne graminicola]
MLFIILFIKLFNLIKIEGKNNSLYINNEIIEKGILNCCNNEWSNCCRQRLFEDKNILCSGLSNEKALKIGICLEKYFYGNKTSIIEKRAFNCCWQLSGEECRQLCYLYLRSPTMPPEQKFTFTNKCLINNINNNNNKEEEEEELE